MYKERQKLSPLRSCESEMKLITHPVGMRNEESKEYSSNNEFSFNVIECDRKVIWNLRKTGQERYLSVIKKNISSE